MAEDPRALASAVDLRQPAEVATVRSWSAGPFVPADDFIPLPRMFQDRAAANPGADAVSDTERVLSYASLAARVSRLEAHLRARGIGRADRVGVCVRRTVDMVTALLAVSATGAAYLPLDPDFPAQRLEFIARDADLRCLVAGGGTTPPAVGAEIVTLEDRPDALRPHCADARSGIGHGDPVYLLYTSGSTGTPKGTVLDHGNLWNFFRGMDEAIGISATDRMLALSSISFDISAAELLWPLTRGASTVIAPERMIERLARGQDSLRHLLRRFQPTLLLTTPSFLAAVATEPGLLQSLDCLRALLIGGEVLPLGLAHRVWMGTARLPRLGVRPASCAGDCPGADPPPDGTGTRRGSNTPPHRDGPLYR